MQRTDLGTSRLWRRVVVSILLLLSASHGLALASQPIGTVEADKSGACNNWVSNLRRTQSYSAPVGDRPASIQRDGTTVIPNGRLITPAGTNLTVAPHPYGLTISSDGKTIVTANSGVAPFSISVLSGVNLSIPSVRQIPPDVNPAPDVLNAVFMGLAIAPDNQTLYVSGGNDGTIAVFNLDAGTRTATIDLNVAAGGRAWKDSYIGDLKLSPDGTTLWAIDQANFRLVGVDLTTKSVARVAPTGRYPSGKHTSIPSIIKTINLFTSAPALNLYDATATDLLDMFTDKPDFTPYSTVPTDPTIFDPSKIKRGNFTAEDLEGGEEIDNAEIIASRQRAEQNPQAASANRAGRRRGFPHDDPYDGADR